MHNKTYNVKDDTLCFTLPYPPSVNHYWYRKGHRSFLGKKGLQFREDVAIILKGAPPLLGEMKITIAVYFPDNRRRDIDNLLKATLDAIEHSGLFKDDNLIADIRIYKAGKEPGGKLEVKLKEL